MLKVEFLRFDMSEYMEKHAVSRLIGAPPGYVGYEEGGLLIDAIRKSPHAVLLLDEIEKAHPDLFAILLQVMDHATLTDTHGRKADFRHVILIMTTNAGARDLSGRKMGFGENAAAAAKSTGVARARCSRRSSATASTPPCTSTRSAPREIERVVDKHVDELRAAGGRPQDHHRADAGGPRAGWRTRASTAPSARGRWRGWSRTRSRSRSRSCCCSATSRTATASSWMSRPTRSRYKRRAANPKTRGSCSHQVLDLKS